MKRLLLLFSALLALSSLVTAQRILLPIMTGGFHAGGAPYSGPTKIQTCTGTDQSGSATSVTCTFGSPIGAGHTLYLVVVHRGTVSSWSGDSGTFNADPGAGTACTNLSWDSGDGENVTCVYVTTTGGGGSSITASGTGLNYAEIIGFELTGATFDKSDDSSFGAPSGNPITSTPALTPTANDSLLIGVCLYRPLSGGQTLSAGTNVAWALGATVYGSVHNVLLETFTMSTAISTTAQCSTTETSYVHDIHLVIFH